MTAQELFYVIASVALIGFLVFLGFAGLFLYALHRRITRLSGALSLLRAGAGLKLLRGIYRRLQK